MPACMQTFAVFARASEVGCRRGAIGQAKAANSPGKSALPSRKNQPREWNPMGDSLSMPSPLVKFCQYMLLRPAPCRRCKHGHSTPPSCTYTVRCLAFHLGFARSSPDSIETNLVIAFLLALTVRLAKNTDLLLSCSSFTMPARDKESTPGSTTSTVMEDPESQQHDPSKTHLQPPSALSRAWDYLNEDVRPSGLVEAELLILTFCIGLQGQ